MKALKKASSSGYKTTHQRPSPSLLANLSRFQRLLLITDGTVTELLEQYLEESIKVLKLHEKVEHDFNQLFPSHRGFVDNNYMPALTRKVLLQGQTTLTNWTYAESSILLNHLPQGFRTDLLTSQEPIGKLWAKYQTETYKVIFHSEKMLAGELSKYFNINPSEEVITRTYGVYSQQKLIMIITETFPDSFFSDQ